MGNRVTDRDVSAKAALIELNGVRRRYAMDGQAVEALAGIDLRIGAGEASAGVQISAVAEGAGVRRAVRPCSAWRRSRRPAPRR